MYGLTSWAIYEARRAKRERMLDAAVRRATTRLDRRMVVWYVDTGPISERHLTRRSPRVFPGIMASIGAEFRRLQREAAT